jgi:hypothetical protein
MKRLFVLLAALAAISAIGASSAFAAGGDNLTCTKDMGSTWQTVAGNLNVPAGATCNFWGSVGKNVTVDGNLKFSGSVANNVTVDPTGHMKAFGSWFGRDVNVTGGQFQSANSGSTIVGSLTITGSQGNPGAGDMNGIWSEYSDTHIRGDLNYTGNAIPLYFQGGYDQNDGHQFKTIVDGNLNYSGNAFPAPQGGPLEVHGQSNIS